MKKIISVLLIAVLALALSCAAFADYSYNPETGKITGSTEGLTGWVEHYVNGSAAGGDTLSINAVEGETYTIEVYENGALVNTVVVTAEAPVVEPEEPTDPVEPEEPTDPVEPEEPTDPVEPEEPTDPVEPEEPTDPVEPEEPTDPVEPEEPEDPADPVTPSEPDDKDEEPKVDENGKDNVPKTGESDIVFILLTVIVLGTAATILVSRKNVGKN